MVGDMGRIEGRPKDMGKMVSLLFCYCEELCHGCRA
jgi:hypothetical protein